MKREDAIAELNAMNEGGDNEIAHGRADDILISVLKAEGLSDLAAAWERAANRVGFWYA